ncbi:hypothetical protein C9374_007477 [Naegleria lovaniensis]|uniref:Uncharacterized protein n=1 Tax=Naegleria lovaniensis TaxID=51637 RepID=A0AA88GIQ3_NAELO|nr:uncharacterized protein C9374_007477 [Naegleria lovaniensis]KAG2379338.1 hypothetical protein C9374_007477 [Naegleria lovaniensis]
MKRIITNNIVQQMLFYPKRNSNSSLSIKSNTIITNKKLLYDPTTTTSAFGQIRSYITTNWLKEASSAPKSSQQITLNLTDYKKWSAQQVASVLTSPESLGGADLSVDDVNSLYENDFDGSALHNVVEDIQKKDEYFALDQFKNILKDSGFKMTFRLSNTCQTVVHWVLDQLMTRQYSLWQLEPVIKHIKQKLGEPIAKGGADLSLDQVSSLDDKSLYTIAQKVVSSEGESVVIGNLDLNLDTIVVEWVKEFLLQNNKIQIELKKFTKAPKRFIRSVLDDFANHVKAYSTNEKESVLQFNEKMKQFQLDKADSPIYLFENEGPNNMEITSSKAISCDLGPTFPSNKYDEHYEFITSRYVLNPLLVLIEATGTGKTHFAYHLISRGHIVLKISVLHKVILKSYLNTILNDSQNSMDLRCLLDTVIRRFIRSYLFVADIIISNMDKLSTMENIENINLYLYKYILNEGFKMVEEVFKQKYEQYTFSPQLEQVMFLIDEAHNFDDFDNQIPLRNDVNNGNLLTLLTSNMRYFGPVILTTTSANAIEDKIEQPISHDCSKPRFEKFSYHFKKPLPILHAKQVTNFLDMFIDTSRKGNDNSEIWNIVATFLQGPIRLCEEFLQQLFLVLCKQSALQFRSFTDLIYTNLCTLVFRKENYGQTKIQKSLYKSLFYRLALLGEVNLTKTNDIISSRPCVLSFEEQNVAKFLLTHGLSYTYDNTNKIYKIISPIERMRLLKTLQQEGSEAKSDWFLYSHKQLSEIDDISPLSEVAAVYFILNHFEFFKQQFPGTYLQKYYSPAKYYIEDSEISKDSLGTDFKISSLLINTMHCNMKGFQTERYPLTGNNDLLSQFLVRPCHHAGPDVLGMLIRSSNVKDDTIPFCIPIVAAVTRTTGDNVKFKNNYDTTDLSNLYYEKVATTISPPTNDLARKERNSLNTAITDIVKTGNMLRILFHPNETFNSSLGDRIPQYDNDDAVETVFSDHAVLTKKGHCIYEISNNNSVWKNYLNSNNMSVVADLFK